MSGVSKQGSLTSQDSPSHDEIWRGSPSSKEPGPSWDSRMGLLSLNSAPDEERTPPRRMYSGPQHQQSPWERTSTRQIPPIQPQLPTLQEQTLSWQQQQAMLREWTSARQIPPIQPQPPTLQEQTLSGQLAPEPLARPPTRRSNPQDSTQPRTRTPANSQSVRQASPPRNVVPPRTQLVPPSPDLIAAYLAIYEGHRKRIDPYDIERPSRRNCSIIVQTNIHTDKFKEFCCIATPQRRPKRHVQFYSSPEIPDPRGTAPGLLAMQFIAWIPRGQIAELNTYMKTWRNLVDDRWTHITWISMYLQYLVNERFITTVQMERAVKFAEQSLRLPFTDNLPNQRQCFPHLY